MEKINIEDKYILLDQHQQPSFVGENDSDYIADMKFDIALADCCDDDNNCILGNLQINLFKSSMAAIDNVSNFNAFDMSGCRDLDQYQNIIFNFGSGELSSTIAEASGYDYIPGDIHILQEVSIYPDYRGNNIGLAVIWIYYRNFVKNYDWILLKCSPLQFTKLIEDRKWCKKMKPEEFKGTESSCFKHLATYYEKLGFRRMGKTDFYLLMAENGMVKPPEIENLL